MKGQQTTTSDLFKGFDVFWDALLAWVIIFAVTFIVGRVPLSEVVSVLTPVEHNIGREINPSLFSDAEFKEKFSQKNHFVRMVVKSDKEFIIGTEDELRRLAEE